MSQIFYSELDKHLQLELDARARAGNGDRSETALRYMTEKVANVSVTAYEGNKRDKTKCSPAAPTNCLSLFISQLYIALNFRLFRLSIFRNIN